MEEREAIELFKETFLKSEELLSVFEYKKEEIVKTIDEAERLDDEVFEKVDRLVRHRLCGCPMLSLAIMELIENEEFNEYKERCIEFYKKTEDKFLKDGLEYFTYARDNFLNQSHAERINNIISDFENKNVTVDTSYLYESLLTRTDFLKLENEANIPKHIDEIGDRMWEYFISDLVPKPCDMYIELLKFLDDVHVDYFGAQLFRTRREYYKIYGELL